MSRLQDVQRRKPGWFARLVFWAARRKLGRVPGPVAVLNANPGLLAGVGAFETALDKADRAPARAKSLAQLQTALLVGCPF